jgi:hypothetical protein
MERALAKVSANLDAKRTKAEATQKEYLGMMAAHTARAKHSFSLDKMFGEKKVKLDEREQDLSCVRQRWWRHGPMDSTPETTAMS